MTQKLFFVVVLFTTSFFSFGQSIWTNPITGVNPNTANPYIAGQTFHGSITVSGIGRGTGITSANATDAYSASGWDLLGPATNDYYQFTLTPNPGYEIDFTNFIYTGAVVTGGPNTFVLRSSLDSYTANIDGVKTTSGGSTFAMGSIYQNITSPVTFRLYGYGGLTAASAFSINDFTFNGAVSCNSNVIATGATICQGGSGTITYGEGSTAITSAAQITGTWNSATNPVAYRPAGETTGPFNNTQNCLFVTSEAKRAYVSTTFQVSVSGNYTFKMTDNAAYDGIAYIYKGSFIPGNCTGSGTFVWGDDDDGPVGTEPRMTNVPLTAGTTYTLISTQYDLPFVNSSFVWTITPPAGGGLIKPNWYTMPTGGTSIGDSSPFNPVGVTGSGLIDTNTAGTTVYYASFPSVAACRTAVNFVINPKATVNGIAVSACTGVAFSVTPVNGTNGVIPTGTTYSWSLPSYNAGAITGAAAGSGSASIFGTLTNTTAIPQIVTYTVTPQSGSCSGTPFNLLVTVNPNASIASVTGTPALCIAGTSMFSVNTVVLGGGTGVWSSSNTAVATVDASGLVTAVASGSADIIYTITGGCSGIKTAHQSVTVNPNIPASVSILASPTGPICSGKSVTFTATPTNGGATPSYQWKVNGSNFGTGTTYTSTTLVNGDIITCVMTSNASPCLTGSPATSNAIVMTVNALPTSPTATVTIHPTCAVNTATIVISSPDTGIEYGLNGVYSTSGTFSNVPIGAHTITVKNSSDCIATMAGFLNVSAPVTKTWTGATDTNWSVSTNWSPSGEPIDTDCVIIPSGTPYSPSISGTFGSFHANYLTVQAGATLIVEKGNTLKVENAVIVAPTGTLTFQDSATLLQESTSDNINIGSINYIRSTPAPGIRQADYVYWSTPVKNQTLVGVSKDLTLSDKYYKYGGTGVSWIGVPKTTIMEIGIGYIIRGPQNWPNDSRNIYTATFTGTPNNGSFTTHENFKADKNYLIGNPYPSALYADKLITDNPALEGTLYFWTHNTPVILVGAYRYKADDYATYNLSGGTIVTKTPAKTGDDDPTYNNNPPSGYIGAGQSFMAAFKADGEITYTNSMRYSGTNNSQFFKPEKTSKTTGLEKNRVWLNIANTEGLFKQMLVGYIEGATNNYEGWYDGLSVNGNKYVDFYSINNTNKFTIQGRALPFSDTDTVPVGYVSSIAGDFTISIDHADGLLDSQAIYLEDKTTGKIHDLRAADYTFTSEIGTFDNRFVLRYTNKTLGTGDFENIENGLLISVKDKTIKVTSAKETITEVTIFDVNGKLLYNKKKIGSTETQITNLQSGNQVLLVKVTLENGFTTTRKIIFQ